MQKKVKRCTINSVTTLNNFALIVKKTINETSESVLFNYYYHYYFFPPQPAINQNLKQNVGAILLPCTVSVIC